MTTIQQSIQQHLDRYEEQHDQQPWHRALNFGAGLSLMESNNFTIWDNVDTGNLEDF